MIIFWLYSSSTTLILSHGTFCPFFKRRCYMKHNFPSVWEEKSLLFTVHAYRGYKYCFSIQGPKNRITSLAGGFPCLERLRFIGRWWVWCIRHKQITGRPPYVSGGRCWLKSEQRSFVIHTRNTYEQYGGYNLFQNAEFKTHVSIKVWRKC